MESIEKTLTYIRDHSAKYAKAKSERVFLEQFRKSKKCILVNEAERSGRKTGQEREAYAYSHPEYIELLEGLKVAVEEEERLKHMILAAKLRVEVWRTEEANNRFEAKEGYGYQGAKNGSTS